MYKNILRFGIKKICGIFIVVLLLSVNAVPAISRDSKTTCQINDKSGKERLNFETDESELDLEFIYNITEALSNIIFTEYNESAGEIAKGRFFETKGEHEAARILEENMTKIGLIHIWSILRTINLMKAAQI